MMHNFKELVALLDSYHRKFCCIRTAIKYAEWCSDYKKISTLKIKEEWISKKIIQCINFYKIQMTDKYLENQIYCNQFAELEQYFQKVFENYNSDKLRY